MLAVVEEVQTLILTPLLAARLVFWLQEVVEGAEEVRILTVNSFLGLYPFLVVPIIGALVKRRDVAVEV